MLSLLHLQSLVAALDHGSLSAAARALGRSQPAVSQHIALLEAEIGQPLLERRPRGVQATPAGKIAASHGRRMLDEAGAMRAALDELRGGVSGRFRLATTTLLAQTLMLPVATRLRLAYPELELELIANNAVQDLTSDEIDLALRFGTPGTGPGRVRKIAELNAILVAAPGYFADRPRPETPADLAGLDFVEFAVRDSTSMLPLQKGAQRLSAPVQASFSAKDPNLLLHAVETGLGFATAPHFLVARQLADGHLERILPDYETEARALYMVLPERVADSLRQQRVRATILTTLAETEGVRLTAPARQELASLPA